MESAVLKKNRSILSNLEGEVDYNGDKMDHNGADSSSDDAVTTSSTNEREEVVSTTPSSLPVLPEAREIIAQQNNPNFVLSDETVSKRESIRARLREREKRLTNLVRNSSSETADSFLGQMKSNREKLVLVEAEKSELEQELQRLKNATDDDEFLKEKMQGIQDGFEKQLQLIQKLEDENVMKSNEIDHLRSELVAKLRRIVELEFDLQTHEVHYTEYADQQFQLGEGALQELKRIEETFGKDMPFEDSFNRSTSSANGQPLTARKAHKLISKLLFDLDNLERRYKENKLECEEQLHAVRLENHELRAQIKILQKRLDDVSDGSQSSEDANIDPTEKMQVDYLRKRVETLYVNGQLKCEEVRNLQKELDELKHHYESKEQRTEVEVERLILDNKALKTRVQQLEMDDTDGASSFTSIEESIQEAFSQISKLESDLAIKNRQITTLKKALTKFRMKQVENGRNKNFTEVDRDILLLAGESSHSINADFGETGSMYVKDLQRQLHAAQQLLVKKDQDLAIERAKATSTAAGLLARITDLSGKHGKEGPEEKKSQRGLFNKQKSSRKDIDDQLSKNETHAVREKQRQRRSFLGRKSSRKDKDQL